MSTSAKNRKELIQFEDVSARYLFEDKALPICLEPKHEGVDLLKWAETHRDTIERMVYDYRALLFRGFGKLTAPAFEDFVGVTSEGGILEYRDRTTPRKTIAGKILTSTVYPKEQEIFLHNEGTYWKKWPKKLYLACLIAPDSGGETPIVDTAEVFQKIDPDIRQKFLDKGWVLVRNFDGGFGLPWQEVFQTKDRQEVERYCRSNDIDFEWLPNNRLRTRSRRDAVRLNPTTGEMVWYNHAAFYHVSGLDPVMRDGLLSEFGEDNLPFATYFGDGEPISAEVIKHIRDIYLEGKVKFPWQHGDILLVDNMSVGHGREPYEGDRNVVVAMAEAIGRESQGDAIDPEIIPDGVSDVDLDQGDLEDLLTALG